MSNATATSGNVDKTTAGWLPLGLLVPGLVALFVAQRVIVAADAALALRVVACAAIGAAFLIRLRDMLRATGEHRRVELMLLLAYGAVIDALVIYALSTRWGLDLLGFSGASADKWSDLLTVAWLAVFVVAFAAVVSMELVFARMPVARAVEVRRVRAAAEAGIGLGLSLIFAASLNYAVANRDIKRDLSYFKTTAASDVTRKMVQELDRPVRAVLFFSDVSDVYEQIKPFFADLASQNPKLRIEVRDHALEPQLARQYKVRDNGVVLLLHGLPADATLTGASALSGKGLTSEQFEIGTDLEKARGKLRTLDETFQKTFAKLSKPARSLHMTTGHNERSESGSDSDPAGARLHVMAQLLKRFNIDSPSLGMAQGLASNVPDEARAVAVIGPREPFLPEEVQSLLRYVERGGRLLLMIDPNVDDGLDPLLAGLGLRREKGVVASEAHHLRRHFNDSDKLKIYTNTYTSHPTVTSCSRFSARIATVMFEAAALTRQTGDQMLKGARITFPVKTSADSWLDVNGNFKRDSNERAGVQQVAAAVTVGTGDKQGRAVVIGDGGFITDELAPSKANLLQFVDSVRWLIGEESVAGAMTSEEDVPIEHRKDDDLLWFYLTTFGVPLPLLGVGLLVNRRRRRDRSAA